MSLASTTSQPRDLRHTAKERAAEQAAYTHPRAARAGGFTNYRDGWSIINEDPHKLLSEIPGTIHSWKAHPLIVDSQDVPIRKR